MLSRLYRIPKTAFPLPRIALRVDVGMGTISFHENKDSTHLQCATVISAKTYPRSVDRHMIKRRVAEVFVDVIRKTPLRGYLVFHPKKQSAQDLRIPPQRAYKEALMSGVRVIEERARR